MKPRSSAHVVTLQTGGCYTSSNAGVSCPKIHGYHKLHLEFVRGPFIDRALLGLVIFGGIVELVQIRVRRDEWVPMVPKLHLVLEWLLHHTRRLALLALPVVLKADLASLKIDLGVLVSSDIVTCMASSVSSISDCRCSMCFCL